LDVTEINLKGFGKSAGVLAYTYIKKRVATNTNSKDITYFNKK